MNGLGMWNWVKFHLQFFRLSTAVGILRYLTGVFPWKFKFKHRAMHFNIFYYIYVLFHLQYDTYVYIIHTCIYIYTSCVSFPLQNEIPHPKPKTTQVWLVQSLVPLTWFPGLVISSAVSLEKCSFFFFPLHFASAKWS